MTRESKPSLFRWNEVVGNQVKANPKGSFFSKWTRWPKKTSPQFDLLSWQREQQLWVDYFSANAFKIQTPCECLFVSIWLFQILWFTTCCIFCPDQVSFTRRWYHRMAGRVTYFVFFCIWICRTFFLFVYVYIFVTHFVFVFVYVLSHILYFFISSRPSEFYK